MPPAVAPASEMPTLCPKTATPGQEDVGADSQSGVVFAPAPDTSPEPVLRPLKERVPTFPTPPPLWNRRSSAMRVGASTLAIMLSAGRVRFPPQLAHPHHHRPTLVTLEIFCIEAGMA